MIRWQVALSGRERQAAKVSALGLLLFCLLAAACAPEPEPVPGVLPPPEAEVASKSPASSLLEPWQQRFADLQEQSGVAGLAVAIGRHGETVWQQGFGFADLEQGVEMSADTLVRVGSVSKTMTSLGLGLLVQTGALDLDAPIDVYLPDYPKTSFPITARQLAGHTAGIRHYRGDEFPSRAVLRERRRGPRGVFGRSSAVRARHRLQLLLLRLQPAERGDRESCRRRLLLLHARPGPRSSRARADAHRSQPRHRPPDAHASTRSTTPATSATPATSTTA